MRSILPVLAAATLLSVIFGISDGEKYVLKVNLGGQRVNDWVPEKDVIQFEDGAPYTRYRGEMKGEPTDDDLEIFKTQRFSRNEDLFMHFHVPDGVYTVTLLFAETYEGAFQPGMRLFDVFLGSKPNGVKKVINSLDIFKEVGGLTPYRRKFKGVATQDGVTLALRPIKQNPQIAGIIFDGHTYQKTLLDDLPTVPFDPSSEQMPDFQVVSRTGPIVNPMEEMYDPQMNPKFHKEVKAAAASQGVSPGAPQGSGTFGETSASSMVAPTGAFAPSGMNTPSAASSSSFAAPTGAFAPAGMNTPSGPSSSSFAAPTGTLAPDGVNIPSAASSSSFATRTGAFAPDGMDTPSAAASSSFAPPATPSVPSSAEFGSNFGAPEAPSDSTFGTPSAAVAGTSHQPTMNPAGSGFALAQSTASSSSPFPAGTPSQPTPSGLTNGFSAPGQALGSQPRFPSRRRLLQENAQASMLKRIQTLNQQIAAAQQYGLQPGSHLHFSSRPAAVHGRSVRGTPPLMGSTKTFTDGFSRESIPQRASIRQQMPNLASPYGTVRQAQESQPVYPGASGPEPSQAGDVSGVPGGISDGVPQGTENPRMPPLDPSKPEEPGNPAYPNDPIYPGASNPMTPPFPGGAEVPGTDVPNYPQSPEAPAAPIPALPEAPVLGTPGSVGNGPMPGPDMPGTPGAPGPSYPGSTPQYPNTPESPVMPGGVGDTPMPGSDMPGAPGAQTPSFPGSVPQYPNAPESPGMPGTDGDASTPMPGSDIPGAPAAQAPIYPGAVPHDPSNPSNPESPPMPVSTGDEPLPVSDAPGVPGTQVPVYPGSIPQYPNAPGSSESQPMPPMQPDVPGMPSMPVEATAQMTESPDHPGIARPGSELNGICINNSTHCSCGIAAPPESPEERTCLFIVNETSSPKVCQKSNCNAQFICGCAEGASMLCERKVARTILTQVDLRQHANPATSQANIVLCERIEIEERIDILEPVLAGY